MKEGLFMIQDKEGRSKFKKIFSALELPMDCNEALDYASLSNLIDYELSIGVEGFYCMGSSGEALLLSTDERKKALECIIHSVDGRVPVIAHVGTIRTADVIELGRHAASYGIDAISMIPPYYYKFSMDEITAYYEEVMQAVPDIPVIIYNIPQFTGIEFSKDNASRLLDNPRVLGVKHTSKDLYSLERMSANYPDRIFFNGFDEQFLAALSMGADATIGTTVNILAPLFIRIRNLYEHGRMKEALSVQQELNYCVEEMCKVGIFNAVKYILNIRGIETAGCRKPFHTLTQEEKSQLDCVVKQYDAYLRQLSQKN
jgi:N-acetylneuraminate lyase